MRDEDLSHRVAEASRKAFTELIERAIAENIAFAVVSGDVYDGEWKDMSIGHFFNREIAKLARAGIPVFMIKGNHDAASEVTRTLPLPDSVTVFADGKAETRLLPDLGVAIHGRSFATRAVTENLARAYPSAEPGYFNIGLLHTSLAGNPAHETYAPCSLDDLAARGYDYWALGHVHEFELVASNPHVVFPGNLQGRSIRECGPKGAVFVDVDNNQVTAIRRVIVDKARFADMTVDISGLESEADVTAKMRQRFSTLPGLADGRLIAVRVRLRGVAPVHAALIARRAQIAENAQSALHHVLEDAWLEKLVIESREPEIARPSDAGAALIDTAALLAGLEHAPEIRTRAEQLIDEIGDKWPSSEEFSKADILASLDTLLDEARTLVLARTSGILPPTPAED